MDIAKLIASSETQDAYNRMSFTDRIASSWRLGWLAKAHDHQIMPEGGWWSIWMMLAGRGAGKTRTAAEQLGWWAWCSPNTRWLVSAPTSSDVRSTCFEGDSGLLSVIPPELIKDYNKALHELLLVNGSLIKGIPASEPSRFRGPQFHGGWCCIPGTLIAMADGYEKAIELVSSGDMVMTRHGPRKVLVSCVSGNPSDLVRIDCGYTSLTVTADHPILVGDRWVPAGDIKEGDLLWATNTSAADTRIASYTNVTSGRFRRVGSFITRMRTRATTILRTLRQCQSLIINGFTQLAGRLLQSRLLLPLRRWSGCALQRTQDAFIAAIISFPSLPIRLESFAQGVVLSGGGETSSYLSQGSVLSAVTTTSPRSVSSGIAVSSATTSQPSEPIALKRMEVCRVERLPNSKTHSLTIEGEHEFIANGVVVHNCDELAAWEYLREAWDQIQFSVRLGEKTHILITTTPQPKDVIIELTEREGDDVVLTTASTYANIDNLADNFKRQILQYEGTKLGRQEIYAEIIDLEEGKVVNRDMFKLWPSGKPFPRFEYIIQSYDCAYTEKLHNDPTAMTTWGVFKAQDGPWSVLLIDCWAEHLEFPGLKAKAIEEFRCIYGEGKDAKRPDMILIEEKAAGLSLIQELRKAHLPVMGWNPGRADKMQRLQITASIFVAGRVWLPESSQRKGFVRDWAEGFLSQLCSFPDSTHDDYVDSCTQALRYLKDQGFLEIDPPPREDDVDEYADYLKEIGHDTRQNPYAV